MMRRGGGQLGLWHVVTSLTGMAWCVACTLISPGAADAAWNWAWRLDALRAVAWMTFVSLLLASARKDSGASALAPMGKRLLLLSAAVLGLLAVLLPPEASPSGRPTSSLGFYIMLAFPVTGLLIAEQFLVSTVRTRWWAVKPFFAGLAAMMLYDLLFFAVATLESRADPDLWGARGIVHVLAALLIAVAAARNEWWQEEIRFSRDAVLEFSSFLVAGGCLLLVSAVGYWVAWFGGDGAGALRVALVFAGLLALAMLWMSGRLRSRLRVFLAEHVLSSRYDYRTEWNRFTRQLATRVAGETQQQQLVRALADLVESTGGQLWVRHAGEYRVADTLDAPNPSDPEPANSAFARALEQCTGCIVLGAPGELAPEAWPEWLRRQPESWLAVPLIAGEEMSGFVLLNRPRATFKVNWEVRDILAIAAAQVAVHLSEVRAKAALVETEKFDAFNRMSAYVVHDLKNLVAQLDLLVRNAERHRDNPEFQADMLATVRHAVNRMQQLMLQLRSGTQPAESPGRVNLSTLVAAVVREKSAQASGLVSDLADDVWVNGHRDRLERVVGHLLQNSIEASQTNSEKIGVRLTIEDGAALLEVSDRGVGMSETFIRDKLFHPFQTTKPGGMGIGMFESSQYVRSLDGRITVRSVPFAGTAFRVHLPLAPQGDVA
jgi:putative PEP-CTERM system histidine kinase